MKRNATIKRNGMKSSVVLVAVLCALALLVMAPQVWAQEATVSDEQIVAFVNSQLQLSEIQQRYEAKIHEAADEQTQHALIQQANTEMVGAIEEEGLSVEEYNMIVTEAQGDPVLMQRIQEELE